jgi:hypothetical protein
LAKEMKIFQRRQLQGEEMEKGSNSKEGNDFQR